LLRTRAPDVWDSFQTSVDPLFSTHASRLRACARRPHIRLSSLLRLQIPLPRILLSPLRAALKRARLPSRLHRLLLLLQPVSVSASERAAAVAAASAEEVRRARAELCREGELAGAAWPAGGGRRGCGTTWRGTCCSLSSRSARCDEGGVASRVRGAP
jgi:hypothetical protein